MIAGGMAAVYVLLAGTIGALLAEGLDPFAAARLGVYLHGLAGEAVRDRFGDAGLLASDLPEAVTLARKRLAALNERSRRQSRLGFGARDQTARHVASVPAAAGPPRRIWSALRPRRLASAAWSAPSIPIDFAKVLPIVSADTG